MARLPYSDLGRIVPLWPARIPLCSRSRDSLVCVIKFGYVYKSTRSVAFRKTSARIPSAQSLSVFAPYCLGYPDVPVIRATRVRLSLMGVQVETWAKSPPQDTLSSIPQLMRFNLSALVIAAGVLHAVSAVNPDENAGHSAVELPLSFEEELNQLNIPEQTPIKGEVLVLPPGPPSCLAPGSIPPQAASRRAHPRALVPRVECLDTASCAGKGKELFDKTGALYAASYAARATSTALNTQTGVGRQIFALFAKLRNTGVRLPPLKSPLLPDSALQPLVDATIHGKDEGHVAFENAYAPGVFAAVHNYREQDTVSKAGQVLNVYNTHGLGDQAAQDDIEWTRWAVDDVECGKAVVMALLGTDNGKGAAFILIDYKTSVGNKHVVAIYTRRQEGSWALVVGYY
ncbi:hypothetical protein GGX14DRAFT_595315 [Mycena pura]|uniref:Uncharacterized protein n=1 Tax=Mycena pura TaxID=153505 RepID=A0AAD6YI19_9AGAR|nr:hypothetical protein GGX14DRAFT_595315 [Mycena pura]